MIVMVMLVLVLLFCLVFVVYWFFGVKVVVSIFILLFDVVILFEKVLYVFGCLCVIVFRRWIKIIVGFIEIYYLYI